MSLSIAMNKMYLKIDLYCHTIELDTLKVLYFNCYN